MTRSRSGCTALLEFPRVQALARFRLRFLLQEFDLIGTRVLIGRSPECQITIEDPLVSRQHAKLRIDEHDVFITDLGSRNGVRVNGRPIHQETLLSDGDRIRIGTQDLVLVTVKRDAIQRATGLMRVCAACSTPFPEVAPACPHCGTTWESPDETLSGLAPEPQQRWTFQLLAEVLEKALATQRTAEADRLMRRVSREVEERVTAGEPLQSASVAIVADYALRLAGLAGGTEWIAWALDLHRRQRIAPAPAVVERLESLYAEGTADARVVIEAFAHWAGTNVIQPSPAEQSAIRRLLQLHRVPQMERPH